MGVGTGMSRRKAVPAEVRTRAGGGIGEEAVNRWRAAIRSSTLGRFHHEMGVELEASGHREAALAAFRRAVAADPRDCTAALRLAGLLEEDGQTEGAEAARPVRLDDPDLQARALAEQAEDVLSAGRTEEAVSLMRRALAAGDHIAAHRPDTVVTLAGALGDRQEEALRWCDLAAPHACDLYGLRHQRGFSLLLLDRQEEARRELLASIAAAPTRCMPSWYVLGQYHRLRFEAGPALLSYCRVRISAHPLRHWAGLMIAHTLLMEGQFGEALEGCDTVRAEAPGMAAALAMRGLAHFRAGEPLAAARDFVEALRIEPGNPQARAFGGLLKLTLNRPREALEDLHGGRGDFASLALPRLGRARALLELGDREEAGRLARAAMAEEGVWIAATLRLLGPLGDALRPLLGGSSPSSGKPA